jgi:hypothetical protein
MDGGKGEMRMKKIHYPIFLNWVFIFRYKWTNAVLCYNEGDNRIKGFGVN